MNERTLQNVDPSASPLLTTGLLQRKCACGNHSSGHGQCDGCQGNRSRDVNPLSQLSSAGFGASNLNSHSFSGARAGRDFSRVAVQGGDRWRGMPAKSMGPFPEDEGEVKPRPRQGAATIQCNGGGGYEIVYNGWAGATCGTKDCVTAHESSHMADWQAKWPTGCNGQPRGYLPKGDPPDNPLMTVKEYEAFLKDSECRAHTVDLACAEALAKAPGCENTIDDYIKLTREQKKQYCGMSRGAKVALGLLGGALAGAGIGFLAGGPLGAAIGAGVGALAGLIGGALI